MTRPGNGARARAGAVLRLLALVLGVLVVTVVGAYLAHALGGPQAW